MITLESNQFIVECEHCLHLCSTDVGEEGFVSIEDLKQNKTYRLEFEVVREGDKKIHIPRNLRDMDEDASNVLPELSGEFSERFERLVEDMNNPGAGHQPSCPPRVKNL